MRWKRGIRGREDRLGAPNNEAPPVVELILPDDSRARAPRGSETMRARNGQRTRRPRGAVGRRSFYSTGPPHIAFFPADSSTRGPLPRLTGSSSHANLFNLRTVLYINSHCTMFQLKKKRERESWKRTSKNAHGNAQQEKRWCIYLLIMKFLTPQISCTSNQKNESETCNDSSAFLKNPSLNRRIILLLHSTWARTSIYDI